VQTTSTSQSSQQFDSSKKKIHLAGFGTMQMNQFTAPGYASIIIENLPAKHRPPTSTIINHPLVEPLGIDSIAFDTVKHGKPEEEDGSVRVLLWFRAA
jgi:hypothetical protein